MLDAKKIDDFSIEITKEVITAPVTTKQTYERGFIEEQIIAITAQRDALIAIKEAELKECQSILDEMIKLGIKVKVELEPTPITPIEEVK